MSIGSKIHIFVSEKLGEGSYGSVYRCSDENGEAYAVKCIKVNDTGIPNILESSIMSAMSHPNLNSALHVHSTPKEVQIFQNLAVCDLAHYTRKRKNVVPPSLLRIWTHSLVQGVACLHRQNIIHADLKANNVLMFKDKRIALGDFTLSVKAWDSSCSKQHNSKHPSSANNSKHQETLFNHRVCTYSHRPPECWFQKGWSYPLDIWSLGCTLFEIAYGRPLFPPQGKITDDTSKKLVYKKAINCLVEWANKGPNASTVPVWMGEFKVDDAIKHKKAVLPSTFNDPKYREFNRLMMSMLRINPLRRPTIREILEDKYFEGLERSKCSTSTTIPKTISRRDQQRLSRYLTKYTKSSHTASIATELYGRCTNLKSVSDQLKIIACVWIAQKLTRTKPKCHGISKSLILQSERKICEHLSFRLHTSG